jgi:hypothetical protein
MHKAAFKKVAFFVLNILFTHFLISIQLITIRLIDAKRRKIFRQI